MKKFISLFLVFSLLGLSGSLYGKERRGAEVILTKKDGQQVRGELIAVKENSLLLLNSEGVDESVDINEIKVIKIVKKSKFLSGAGIGLLAGGGIGAVIGFAGGDDSGGWFSMTAGEKALVGGLGLGIVGILIGGLSGVSAGTDKKIQIEGRPKYVIKREIENLHSKARIRDYK